MMISNLGPIIIDFVFRLIVSMLFAEANKVMLFGMMPKLESVLILLRTNIKHR